MKSNQFIWADLSTYHPNTAIHFYEQVFNWQFYHYEGYYTAYNNLKQVAGLYETPKKFQEMKMPSFWMSYIQVESVEKTVEKSRALGGIIEMVDLENSIGSVALIRDTLGAGFTVYEGNGLNARTVSNDATLIYNELQVSNVEKAVTFYEGLFEWNFEWLDNYSVDVYCKFSGEKIASIYELPNSVKGKYEYWVCTFGVKDLESAVKKVQLHDGAVISSETSRVLCSDGSEAFFYLQEI